ncbi:MAG TPA: hypothetical protein VNT99_02770 [Methylomirabilota bacterium]|nr:hypothetical protein [Methylomirabilota bacterium]
MNVTITDKDWYQAWVVSADFGQPKTYLVYMEMFNLESGNYFYEKHMKDSANEGLARRNLSAFRADDLSGRADAVARTNVKLKPNAPGLEAKGAPKTNTGIDWDKTNVKSVAFQFAEALLNQMLAGKFGDHLKDAKSGFIDDIEVDLGCPCVVSAGQNAAVGSTIKIGAERISTLNGKNQVSFKVSHCGGI